MNHDERHQKESEMKVTQDKEAVTLRETQAKELAGLGLTPVQTAQIRELAAMGLTPAQLTSLNTLQTKHASELSELQKRQEDARNAFSARG